MRHGDAGKADERCRRPRYAADHGSDCDRNPCAVYTGDDGTVRYQLWYEDARSVTDKIELARMFGVNGVSLWRIGNIPSYAEDAALYYDVWPAILAQRP